MEIEVTKTCPLGSSCEKVVHGKIERCMWYIKMEGENPQTGEKVQDLWDCAMNWQVLLLTEGNKEARVTAASVQSLRNETTKRQDIALGALTGAKAIT
jgi:hypothetical protein